MSENDTDKRIAEGEKIIRKKHPITKEVNVTIDTKNVEKLIEHNKELELENRQLREGKVPKSEEFEAEANFEDKMHKFVRTMKRVEKEIEQEENLAEAIENDYDIREGGKGVLRLTEAQRAKERPFGSEKKGYPSYEQMIDDLAENDPEKLNQLKEKWVNDVHEYAEKQGSGKAQIVWRDKFEVNPETGRPESAMFRQIRLANEKKRKKALGEK
jgi:hypothetical protein